MYFCRLAALKPAVEKVASAAWEGFSIGGDTVRRVERVLDVRQGELVWIVGTVYMQMPLKPNILDDISKDVSGLQYRTVAAVEADCYSTGSPRRRRGVSSSPPTPTKSC